jgi:hypothetical protein
MIWRGWLPLSSLSERELRPELASRAPAERVIELPPDMIRGIDSTRDVYATRRAIRAA